MFASNRGIRWLGDVSPERMLIDSARNVAMKQYLGAMEVIAEDEPEYNHALVWVDNDIVLPIDAIARLATSVRRGKDFVTGIYFQRNRPHWPLIAAFNKVTESFTWAVTWPENVVAPIDGCGFGVCITSLKLLRAMADKHEHPFAFTKYSEDFTFCRRAADLGFQLHVDTGILCGHLMDPVPATVESFKSAHKDLQSPQAATGGGHDVVAADGSVG